MDEAVVQKRLPPDRWTYVDNGKTWTRKGTMTDDDARPLVESFGAFQHLEKLDLSENYLSPATIESLGSACCEDQYYDDMVRERDQHGHEEWAKDATFRYTRVGE